MAASNAPNPLSVSTPNQISKDMLGPDNPIPLSPQWLLSKPGEDKAGMAQEECHLSSHSYGDGSDVIKPPGNGEVMHEGNKKKDVFRPTFHDMESGRRDGWRDEERDTNLSIHRDNWRQGEKEFGDNRKPDRWVDNSPMRTFAEARRVPTGRWADPNRDNNYDQRRESKWNTRWGPDDREMDKWADVGKHGDLPHDKGLPHLVNHGKDEREGEHSRPWRPSSLQSRGRAEPPYHQNQKASKEGLTFGHGRGRGEISPSTFSIGRARSGGVGYNSSHSQSVGPICKRGDNSLGESYTTFRYSRTKLLDIYRVTDVRSSNKTLDGLLQAPSLTQEEPLEPLSLCAPSPEESAVLKGIDKGDIVSSGAPQVSKDGSAARSSVDYLPSRRTKLGTGSRDDASLPSDNANDKADNSKGAHSKFLEGSSHEKQAYAYGSNATLKSKENHHMYGESKYSGEAGRDDSSASRKDGEVFNKRDSTIKGSVPAHSGTPRRSPSVGENVHPSSHEWSDGRARSSDIGWSQGLKDCSNEEENCLSDPSYAHDECKWQIGEYSAVRKHPMVVDREQEARKLLQPAPEDLLLYYRDPQGLVQGPFSGTDIIGWFEAGYFGIDLQVRLANAPNDSPFSLLGDVMPHLRSKAGPPPGFNAAKQNEATEVSGRSSLSGFGKVLPGHSGIDLPGNELRNAHGSSVEAENRFLESLMSGDYSNSPLERFTSAEGLQGSIGHTSSSMPPMEGKSGDALNLLARRMNLERQKSLPHQYPYWPARDAAPVVAGSDILREASMPQANLLPVADVPRQAHLQNVEMSIVQGLSDRSASAMNNEVGGWPNFSVQGGLEPFKDKIEMHHGQSIAQAVYGMQQQKMQPQNQPSIPNLLAQTLDSPSILTDKLLSSGLVQDPQVLNLLQQQYLLQLQSQQSMSVPQLSLLDKILLLKHQQKQEEQQLLLRQQQQLLSQVLSEQHLAQRFSDPSFGQVQPSAKPVGNAPTDQSLPHLSHQLFQNSSQLPVSGTLNDRNVNYANLPMKVSQDLSHTFALDSPSLHLPHQIYEVQNSWPLMPANSDNLNPTNSSLGSVLMNMDTPEAMENSQCDCTPEDSTSECSAPPSNGKALQDKSKTSELALPAVCEVNTDSSELPELFVYEASTMAHEDELRTPDRVNDAKVVPIGSFQEKPVKENTAEGSAANEAKKVEAREVKKTSEKKSRKLKPSKAQASSDYAKEAVKTSQSKQSETEGANVVNKSQIPVTAEVTTSGVSMQKIKDVSHLNEIDSSSATLHDVDLESEFKVEQEQSDSITLKNKQVNSAHRGWKPAVSVKPKSLLEIQQEEQRKARMEIPLSGVSSSATSRTPWPGVAAYSEPKVKREVYQDGSNSKSNIGELESKVKKSELHDLLAQEVLAKSNERDIVVSNIEDSLSPLPNMSATQLDMLDDDKFIEAKETKKSRKKAAKAKGAGTKASTSVTSADVTFASNPIEQGRASKHVQSGKEVLPAPSSGPSLGDFVPWTGESTSPSPSPAWSSDPVKLPKPTSLRDILREQEKKGTPSQQHSQMSALKAHTSQTRPTSWSASASQPPKPALPVKIHAHVSAQSKFKGEDDLFWGSPDHSKQATKQLDSQSENHGSRVTKSSPAKGVTKSSPAKGVSAASLGRQKSVGSRPVEHSFSSTVPAQSLVKGKKDGGNKNSDAMDFRDWCECESVRLTGSKDTSFLEFCLKQSRSEAEILLIENLGSFDPNHEFIEKFLNYKELMPADVLEIAFQSRNDLKASKTGARDMIFDNVGVGDIDRDNGVGADGSTKGGRKKGKKGKKVSSAVLGFNVVSNRIMMGEIQSVED